MDKTSIIFGNPIDKKTIKKAEKSKKKYLIKFTDDSNKDYKLGFEKIDSLSFLGAKNIVFKDHNEEFPKNGLIVGNIRMGFGHYRISIAMASCARALGYEPLWLDLAGFDATGSKMIRYQNDLYSMASRISQKNHLFNHFVWEPLNRDGFKKLTYNAIDQKNSEILVPIFRNIPKDMPYIGTHVWPSQAAIHAGMSHVVNAIPDNWPMALHLSEGAIHTVQTPFAYLGYKTLKGFSKETLHSMPESDLKMVGHYVDHELVSNLKDDNANRISRIQHEEPLRILLTVGGAGAGASFFMDMVEYLLPYVKDKKVSLFINFGDHLDVYDFLKKKIRGFQSFDFFNEYDRLKAFSEAMDKEIIDGIHCIYNQNIFEAVYSTNLLMRHCDLMVTKPSELTFYPIPKIFMRHIGGHEVYGARYGAEIGDATMECPDKNSMHQMLYKMMEDKEILLHMIRRIDTLKDQGYYDGAYECVRLAVKGRQ